MCGQRLHRFGRRVLGTQDLVAPCQGIVGTRGHHRVMTVWKKAQGIRAQTHSSIGAVRLPHATSVPRMA
eukprot:1790075-Rhodomonas_salina.1